MVLAIVQHVRGTPRAGQEVIEPCKANDQGDREAGTKTTGLVGRLQLPACLYVASEVLDTRRAEQGP